MEKFRYLVESNVPLDLLSGTANTPILMPSHSGEIGRDGKRVSGPTNVNPGTADIKARRLEDWATP